MSESMRKIVYYENILEFKENTKSELIITELNNWQLCRTCLIETSADDADLAKMCVIDALEGRFLNVQEMLMKATGLEIAKEPDLPLRVCRDCLGKITSLYYFTLQVHKAEKVLKRLVHKLKGEVRIDSSPAYVEDNLIHLQTEESFTTEEQVCQSSLNTEYVINDIHIQEVMEHTDVHTLSNNDDCRDTVECLEELVDREEPDQNDDIFLKDDFIDMKNPNEEDSLDMKNINEEQQELYLDSNSPDIKQNENEAECNDEEEQELYLDNNSLNNPPMDVKNKEKYECNDEDDVLIITAEQIEDNSNTSDSHNVQVLDMDYQTETTTKLGFKHRQHRVKKPLLDDIKCAVCTKIFCRQRDLVKHARELHPNSKAFKCRDCGMLFSYMQSLSRHMNTHKDMLVKNVCEFCSKSFVRVDDLKRHVRVHTGVRPYSCSVCAKTFKQHGEMKSHHATHYPQLNPFACDQCERIFSSRNGLYLHKKTHTTNFDNSVMFQKELKKALT